jgi:hypothetical protein
VKIHWWKNFVGKREGVVVGTRGFMNRRRGTSNERRSALSDTASRRQVLLLVQTWRFFIGSDCPETIMDHYHQEH